MKSTSWDARVPLLAVFLLTSPATGQPQAPDAEMQRLEAEAQTLYAADDLEGAADRYRSLSRASALPADQARFSVLAGWLHHQRGAQQARDEALRTAMLADLEYRAPEGVFSAEFLELLQEVRLQTEQSTLRRSGELTRIAQQALRRGDNQGAAAAYTELLELDPSRHRIRLQLGTVLLNAGEPARALEVLAPAERDVELLDPEFQQRLSVILATARIRVGALDGLEQTIQRIRSERQRLLWLELAGAHERNGDIESALDAYNAVLEIDPADREIALLRSQRLLRAGRPAEAESFLINLTETLPDANSVWNALGEAREALGDVPGALAAYRRAAESAPSDTEDREGLVAALLARSRLIRDGERETARSLLARAEEIAPNAADVFAAKARFLSFEGRHREAIAAARRAAELDQNRPDLENLLGNTLYLAGAYADSIVVFERLLQRHPELTSVRQNLELARSLQNSAPGSTSSPATPGSPADGQASASTASGSEGASATSQQSAPATTSTREPSAASSNPRRSTPEPRRAPDPQPDPSELPTGLELSSYRWQRTGRTVLRVDSVQDSSKAARCGLQSGDLLIRVDGRSATSASDVQSRMQGDTSGLRLDIVRDDESSSLVCV